ncbi:MAG TPA: sulfotransferase domain-containing protein [Isosphaeraceae bacterium]|nr:sulfotransferase domain-containing protein [Isosphaeraceae bacterium]
MSKHVIIVSGLPRSGTSLMMQMLDQGGVEVVTDNIRSADTDNPRGYYELEQVKKIKNDVSWLPATRGKAFKMVSQLLYELPPTERYRIIFMERNLHEMLVSQEKMLARLNKPAAPRAAIERAFIEHLRKLRAWLASQPNIDLLYVSYNELLVGPEEQAKRVSTFLEGQPDAARMAGTVDSSLYRNRKTPVDRSS